jgi:3-oxoacyl-[acyl-carrier-protein] synthase-3
LDACRAAGVAPDDIAAFVPHQANLRIIDALARRIGLPNATIAQDIVTSGNTSAASIPLAFSRMVEHGEIASGAPVLLLGFGSGLAYAGQVVLAP